MSWSTEHAVFYGLVLPRDLRDRDGIQVDLSEIDTESGDETYDPLILVLRDARVDVGMHGDLMGKASYNLHIAESWISAPDSETGEVELPAISGSWFYRIRDACVALGISLDRSPSWHFVSITG